MNAVPDRAKEDKSEVPQYSRLEGLRRAWSPDWLEWVSQSTYESLRAEYMPELPPLDGGEHLLAILFEVGPVLSGGMGAGPLTHEELRAWQSNVGVELTSLESRTLRRLSLEYLSEQSKATARDCPAPWCAEDAKPEVTAAQAAIRALANL